MEFCVRPSALVVEEGEDDDTASSAGRAFGVVGEEDVDITTM